MLMLRGVWSLCGLSEVLKVGEGLLGTFLESLRSLLVAVVKLLTRMWVLVWTLLMTMLRGVWRLLTTVSSLKSIEREGKFTVRDNE
jgi:hypothetical protein